MMTTKREVVEKMCGGKGHVIIDRISVKKNSTENADYMQK